MSSARMMRMFGFFLALPWAWAGAAAASARTRTPSQRTICFTDRSMMLAPCFSWFPRVDLLGRLHTAEADVGRGTCRLALATGSRQIASAVVVAAQKRAAALHPLRNARFRRVGT